MPEYCEFEVSLADVEPTIWRRFRLSADPTFLGPRAEWLGGWEPEHFDHEAVRKAFER